jgi:hypothetical protein
MIFNVNDLVLVRLNNDPKYIGRQRHYNIWLKVLFIDDGSFHGKIEHKDRDFELSEIGEILTLKIEKVLDIFNENDGKQWCYSDNVTRCNCPGLCRNNM